MVMLKRLREIEESEAEMDSIKTANFLVLLSRGDDDGGMVHPESLETEPVPRKPSASGQVFECKTCNRQFSSFQALGGHRTSHNKARTIEDSYKPKNSWSKRKSHECSICGLEFAMGQALGGHMRIHRNAVERFSDENKGGSNKSLCLDHNSSSSDGEPIFLFGMVLGRKRSTVH